MPVTIRQVTLLSLCAFATALALRLCDPLLPVLGKSFGVSTAQAAIVITATGAAYSLCQFLFGPLGDRFGKFRIISWACLASTVGALGCALSPTLTVLTLARTLNGATTAALIPLAMAWIGDAAPFEQRQPLLARFMSGQIIGLISGQAVGGLFADTIGWRWAFVLLAGVYGVVGGLLLFELRRQPKSASVIAAAPSPANLAQLLQAIRAILGLPRARVIFAVVSIEALVTFGVMAFIPAFLHETFGLSLFHAGLVVALFGLGGMVYTAFARRWLRALGEEKLARLGGALLGAAFLLLALAPSWSWGIAASLLAGLGFYQFHNTLQTHATQMAPNARGTAVSLFASCFFLAQAVGVSLSAFIIHHVGARWLFVMPALALPLLGWRFGVRLRVWRKG